MTAWKLTTALLAFATATAIAGWEDTGTVRQPAPSPQTAQPTTRRQAPAVPANQRPAANRARTTQTNPSTGRTPTPILPPDLYSAFLDTDEESSSWYRLTFIASGDVGDAGEGFGLYVADAHFKLSEFRGLLYGDLTIDLDPSLGVLTDDAGFSCTPSILVALPVDFTWIWRYLNGWSLELGVRPGIYADTDGLFQSNSFGVPFRGCFYYALSSETAIRFGAEIRPGWDLIAMPLLGVAWEPSEMFLLELGLPRSLAKLQIGPIDVYGKIVWENTTYALDAGDGEPDAFTLNGWKFGAGAAVAFTEDIRLAFEAGIIAGRKIKFEGGDNDLDLDVDTVPYFSILFGSEF